MKNKYSFLFSMPFMGILLIVFALSMAIATFIERDYGTIAARQVVFNAKWFELLLVLLTLNLIGNVLINKLYRKEKITIFIFHVSFIVIIVGAAITRYFGFEGMMRIREVGSSDEIQSDQMFIHMQSNNNIYSQKAGLSVLTKKSFKTKVKSNTGNIIIRSLDFIPHADEKVIETPKGKTVLKLVFSDMMSGRQDIFLSEGQSKNINGLVVGFNQEMSQPGFLITEKPDGFYFNSAYDIVKSDMTGNTSDILKKNQETVFLERTVYNISGLNLVFAQHYKNAEISLLPGAEENKPDAVVLEVRKNSERQVVTLYGQRGLQGMPMDVYIEGRPLKLSYGPGIIKIPFSIKLNDFVMERYPGSNSPSSFASFVTLTDNKKNTKKDAEISMNNILHYKGYRFYQSSYDEDEKGSVLSVNHDLPGTVITYIGYILLATGMFLSLFNKRSRLKKLSMSAKVLLLLILIQYFHITDMKAETSDQPKQNPVISTEHAKKIDGLLVQDNKGRLKPFNTLSSEILRKIYRKDIFNGLHSNQVILGMMVNPQFWQQQPMIRVNNEEIRKILSIEGKYASFVDFFKMENNNYEYVLSNLIEQAFHKKPGERSKFDTELIKTDERLNICYLVYTGDLFRILPLPEGESDHWQSYSEIPDNYLIADSISLKSFIPLYFENIEHAIQSGEWQEADELVELLIKYQQKFGAKIITPESKVKLEIIYNEFDIFARLSKYYGYLGLVFLILLFIAELFPRHSYSKIHSGLSIITFLFFLLHTAGLAMRWYISGHAPWSNGYESLIYISWATVLAGIIFSRHSFFTLAATSILASVILSVAHLSWLDPEITNLVPVLKSYWLTIHVSVITSSYGFFGLAALLASVNLLLMISISSANYERIENTIIKISGISEMSIIIGLYLLTIGTFLGGVWANESWGRYWGWDPKETWALITVIVYAFITHMRFIPGLKSLYTFNLMSLLGYGSVIMTYFGVNYYLAGLHSYAKGDPIPLPSWVYYALTIIFIVAALAYFKNKTVKKFKLS